MVTVKYFIPEQDGPKQIVWYQRKGTDMLRWYYKDGTALQEFLNSNVSSNYDPMDDIESDILISQAYERGMTIMKRYYVTPPDYMAWWHGTYVCTPEGRCIHIDPRMYGEKGCDPYEDVSDKILPLIGTVL